MSRRLLIFTKGPAPGRVKTRLVPPCTPEQAARVHAAALLDTVEGASRGAEGAALELWIAGGPEALAAVARLVPGRRTQAQSEGDLGARLADAFARSFAEGAERVLILGSDHPTLPPERVRAAFRALSRPVVVLGPSRDGGYYAVGLRRESWPAARAIFDGIPWSSPEVLAATATQARRLGFEAALLEEWYDVDDADDLERARRDATPGSALTRLLEEPGFRAIRPGARR